MTELEKIAYAKSFIDKLANGINPLDDMPIPDGDIVNNVRLSRCFFYVSGILQKEIERERRKMAKGQKVERLPFQISAERLQDYEYPPNPISATAITRKLNNLVRAEINEKRIESLSYRKITQWLLNIGMLEYREWENGMMKRVPTPEGEAIGLVLEIWENYGRRSPVVFYSEAAQRFIIDHLEAVIATEIKKGKTSYSRGTKDEESEDPSADESEL